MTTPRHNPTINDVARLAEVSKKTVSRVINNSPFLSEKTRLRVQSVIRDLGYVPNPQARALALRHNFVVAVIHDNPNAQFLVTVQKGILQAIKGTEFGLMVQPVDRNSPNVIAEIGAFLERQRPYGVILLPPISENNAIAELCETFGTRYIRMTSVALDQPSRMVISNDKAAVNDAVRYLIACGHEKIALIEGPKGFASANERRAGYMQAMEEAGLPVEPWMVKPGSYTFESGVASGLALLDGAQQPTAVFVSNDEMAIGVMIAARQKGIEIPRGLSIVGFDDTPLSSHVWPALTTVRWPIIDMAMTAAKKLISEDHYGPPDDQILGSTLIKRDSVAVINKRTA